MLKSLYFVFGLFFVGLAFVGAFLPIMPSTIFVIFAAACFARSSSQFEAWLLEHKQFGPSLVAWREHGAILPSAKVLAICGMIFGYGLFWLGAQPGIYLALAVAAFFIGSAVYVLSRPSGPRQT